MSIASTIILGGLPGTGSTTAAQHLAEHLGYEHIYGGGIFRQMAAAAGQKLEAYMADLSNHPERELEVDEYLVAKALAGNVIIESRVVAWLMPRQAPARNIWLTCQFEERVRRIEGREPEGNVRNRVIERESIDAARYQQLYGIDLEDLSVYDAVLDTTHVSIDETWQRILQAVEAD